MNKYSLYEIIDNTFSLIYTKIAYPSFRLLRRPAYIRGGTSIEGGYGLTTGRFCRFDLPGGKKKTLHIGKNCQFGDNTHIVALKSVHIGENVLIASKVFISDTSHGSYTENGGSDPVIAPSKRKLISHPVKIGDNVWIGENVVVLSGVEIGKGCVIGANSVVTKNIEEGSIACGIPARVIKRWSHDKRKWIPTENTD
jgi:acetyltransferase-like isoleucine patch superfamily enzyme